MENDGSAHQENVKPGYDSHNQPEHNFPSVGDQIQRLEQSGEGGEYSRLGEEIESLCMNCGDNVRFYKPNNESLPILKA